MENKTMEDIGDFMTSKVLSVDSEATVQDAINCMHYNDIGSVLVKDGDEYIGIVTETVLIRKVLGKRLRPDTTIITSVMTSPVLSLDRYLPVEEANKFMHKNRIRHLAVTEDEKIVGVLSIKDLVSYFTQDFRMQE
ncbi:MAG: signal-transduction protein with cAMP-binding, CBS, and nucleotidyltransferase domain [Nitrospinales bacterium]|jgi:signal-transduction protein with cAMP-binding, CBS, and nucleotidyltransferase domain